MPKQLTREELGIPWYKSTEVFIDDKDGIMVARIHKDHLDRLDFIILAANNYHALVEALKASEEELQTTCYCCKLFKDCHLPCRLNNVREANKEALLATHTQEEAK